MRMRLPGGCTARSPLARHWERGCGKLLNASIIWKISESGWLNSIAPSQSSKVPATSLNPSHARERLAAGLVTSARLSFATLMFVSPLAWSWNLLERRSGNVFSSYTDFWLFVSDLFLWLTLGFWLLSRLARPRPLRRGPWFLTAPIVGLVTLSWVGVFTGIDPALTLYHSIRFTLLLGLYLFLVDV